MQIDDGVWRFLTDVHDCDEVVGRAIAEKGELRAGNDLRFLRIPLFGLRDKSGGFQFLLLSLKSPLFGRCPFLGLLLSFLVGFRISLRFFPSQCVAFVRQLADTSINR